MAFEFDNAVQIDRNTDGSVLEVRHVRKPYGAETAGLVSPTIDDLIERYVQDVSSLYEIAPETSATLREAFTASPAREGARLKRAKEKSVAQTKVVEYQETYSGLPVWNSTLRIVLAGDPPQIISSSSSLVKDITIEQPRVTDLRAALKVQPTSLQEALGIAHTLLTDFKLNHTRLLVYLYDPEERLDKTSVPVIDSEGRPLGVEEAAPFGSVPTLPLPDLPTTIEPGKYYVVRELLFSLSVPEWGGLNWRAFIEIETGAVLYLRALTAGQTCCVFITDPVSATGQPLTGGSPAADLDAARTLDVTLDGLNGPENNQQSLDGEFVEIRDTDPPIVVPPTEGPPYNFCYSAVTDNFAAACAYHNHDAMFRMVQDFGFPIANYFDGADFPVPVDHRGWNIVNAQAPGNTQGDGIGRFRYGLAASGQPVSIACDPRVCLHEFGHALLWDHVSHPNFGWCHSAGDTLAAILHDPGSRAHDRFETFPFIPIIANRRHDRDVGAGWAWGGEFDNTQYGSEQILSTLMFRIYRVAGGDDQNVDVQRFAARYLAYLIVHGIGQLTATSRDPRTYVNALMNADETTVSFEGHPGGAWHKVIRWSFEKQGLYQPAGSPRPVTQPGAPPDVDVYIDDGRQGEYEPYQTTFTNTPGVWNRRASDGLADHQAPAPNSTNYIYVRVENRGTQTATGVRVRVYQGSLGTALNWPSDWQPVATPELSVGTIPPGRSAVVGPFHWMPPRQGSVVASVSVNGDISNAETVNGSLPMAHLALLDNNIARRDMKIAAAIDPTPWLSILLTEKDEVSPGIVALLTDD